MKKYKFSKLTQDIISKSWIHNYSVRQESHFLIASRNMMGRGHYSRIFYQFQHSDIVWPWDIYLNSPSISWYNLVMNYWQNLKFISSHLRDLCWILPLAGFICGETKINNKLGFVFFFLNTLLKKKDAFWDTWVA